MAGGSGRVRTGGGITSRQARVENERLWVDAVLSGGGGAIAANVTIVGPLPVPVETGLGKAEDSAHASGDVGVMSLAVRQDTLAALAANGDYIPLTTDSLGRLNVRAAIVEETHPLSSSTGGQPISVNGVGFITLHTVPAGKVDTVTIYVSNIFTQDETFIVGLGGTLSGQQLNSFLPIRETVVVVAEAVMTAGQVISGALAGAGATRVFGKVVRRDA